jgi:hypothetical protein
VCVCVCVCVCVLRLEDMCGGDWGAGGVKCQRLVKLLSTPARRDAGGRVGQTDIINVLQLC